MLNIMVMKLRNNNKPPLHIFTRCPPTAWQQPKVVAGLLSAVALCSCCSKWEDWAVAAAGWWHFTAFCLQATVVLSFSDLKISAVCVAGQRKNLIGSCTDKKLRSWCLSRMSVNIQVSLCTCISVSWIWSKSGPSLYRVVMLQTLHRCLCGTWAVWASSSEPLCPAAGWAGLPPASSPLCLSSTLTRGISPAARWEVRLEPGKTRSHISGWLKRPLLA